MRHAPGQAEARFPMCRTLLLGLGLTLLWGCASEPRTSPIVDAQGRLQGNGFTVTPPLVTDGWVANEKTDDAVVFVKSSDPKAQEEPKDKIFVHASLGVVNLPAKNTQSADEASFAQAAKQFLTNRFIGQVRITLADLRTEPYTRNGAVCARFTALQVDRYTRRQQNGKLEYLNRGFLCRHPDDAKIVIHGFFNKLNYRLAPKPDDPKTEKEADQFLESVVFSPLR